RARRRAREQDGSRLQRAPARDLRATAVLCRAGATAAGQCGRHAAGAAGPNRCLRAVRLRVGRLRNVLVALWLPGGLFRNVAARPRFPSTFASQSHAAESYPAVDPDADGGPGFGTRDARLSPFLATPRLPGFRGNRGPRPSTSSRP